MGRFDGTTVLITGAAGGLGRGAAKGFAAEGARLVLSDIDEKALADLAGMLQAETAFLAGNIADEKLSDDLVRLAVEKFGRLDVAMPASSKASCACRKSPRMRLAACWRSICSASSMR